VAVFYKLSNGGSYRGAGLDPLLGRNIVGYDGDAVRKKATRYTSTKQAKASDTDDMDFHKQDLG